ncbi:MAG: metallophosphoesterase, partial [Candidatus Solibacter sp.]|nr:metallophosphoesterase [Candidatus Solibacter sp.]
MPNLLHLSDLHFGYDQDATAQAQRGGSLDLLVKEVRKLGADWKPDIVVISGDLTWQGKASGYAALAEWLTRKLLPAAGLGATDCVVCPGNHDIDREAAFCLDARTQDAKRADELLRPERLARGFAMPFEAFVKFAKDFGIPAPLLHGQPSYLAGVRELHGLRFVCANSAWFCRDSNTDRS